MGTNVDEMRLNIVGIEVFFFFGEFNTACLTIKSMQLLSKETEHTELPIQISALYCLSQQIDMNERQLLCFILRFPVIHFESKRKSHLQASKLSLLRDLIPNTLL